MSDFSKFKGRVKYLRHDMSVLEDARAVAADIAQMGMEMGKTLKDPQMKTVVIDDHAEYAVFAEGEFGEEEAKRWILSEEAFGEKEWAYLEDGQPREATGLRAIVWAGHSMYAKSIFNAIEKSGMEIVRANSAEEASRIHERLLGEGNPPDVTILAGGRGAFEALKEIKARLPEAFVVGASGGSTKEVVGFIRHGARHVLTVPCTIRYFQNAMSKLFPHVYEEE